MGMNSWFSDQLDRTFLFESNDMLPQIFLARNEGTIIKTKSRPKQVFLSAFEGRWDDLKG